MQPKLENQDKSKKQIEEKKEKVMVEGPGSVDEAQAIGVHEKLSELSKKSTVVVAYMGPKKSGKTTACKHLVENYGGNVVSFADELKSICMQAFELTKQEVNEDKEKDFVRPVSMREKELRRIAVAMEKKLDEIMTGHGFQWRKVAANKFPMPYMFKNARQILQYVGTEVMHELYRPFHCAVVKSKISGPGLFFIDDLRFESEEKFLRSAYPILSTVVIKGRNESKNGNEEHASESDWKHITPDYKITNSKSLSSYKDGVLSLFLEIIEKHHGYIETHPKVDTIIMNVLNDSDKTLGSNQEGTMRVGRFGFSTEKTN